jgi:hypothetical protein
LGSHGVLQLAVNPLLDAADRQEVDGRIVAGQARQSNLLTAQTGGIDFLK